MRRIAFVNEKGGSCKTTLAVNIAARLASAHGQKVLLVDIDPQGQSGKSIGINVKEAHITTLELLRDPNMTARDAMLATRIDNLKIIVANKNLADFAVICAADEDRTEKLKKKIDALRGFDYVIFDSPPSLGLLTLNIMLASKEIFIPVSLQFLALDGCAEIVETVETVRRNYNKAMLKISLVIPTLFRHTRLSYAVLNNLREYFGNKVSNTVITYNVKIDEAQSTGKTIFEYSPRSRGAEMLSQLSAEIFSMTSGD